MPNKLAYLALMMWPFVAIIIYKRLPIERAVIWSLLGAYLFLPPATALDFPLIPQLDKVSIPCASALLICVFMLGHKVPLLPLSFAGRALVLLFMLTPIASVLTNSDPIVFTMGELPGLRVHDLISSTIAQGMAIVPFMLGRRYLGTEKALRELLIALVIAGLVYSIPMMIEVRLSPQINVWVYGFFQHDFSQMMRQGGFRPIVFLQHGLWVAFLTLMTLISAVALWRWPPKAAHRKRYFWVSGYLAVLLVMCKSMAALLYGMAALPLTRFAKVGTQLRIAALLGVIAISYPLLRGAQLVPVEAMISQAEAISADRAASIAFRFMNEEVLLDHARERPWFGWGPWGRNQLHDPYSGNIVSVTDGRWIIVIGTFGWAGYIAEFGLLALPLLMLARRSLRRDGPEISHYAAPLALMLGLNMIDMLPNATLIPFTWLIAGALLSYAEARRTVEESGEEPGEEGASAPMSTRPRTVL